MKLAPFAGAAAAVWMLALPLIAFVAPAAGQPGLLTGWCGAGVSGLLTFALLAYSNGKSLKGLGVTVVGGFAGRMVIAVIGLLVATQLGYGLGWFCASFFALYWLFFGLEFLALRYGTSGLTTPEAQ